MLLNKLANIKMKQHNIFSSEPIQKKNYSKVRMTKKNTKVLKKKY